MGPQGGKVEWLFDAGSTVYSSPAIDLDGTVYFGCDNRYFYAVTPSGNQKWAAPAGGGDSSPLIASDGTIYIYGGDVAQQNMCLYSYDRSGSLNWQYSVGQFEALTAPSIAKDGQMIYLAAHYLYAITKDGTLYWRMSVPDSTDESFHYSLAISPDGATLYVPGYAALYAIDTSGTLKWRFKRGYSPSSPAVDNDGNIYIGIGPESVISLAPSGTVRWECTSIMWGPEDPGPVIGRDGTIYITGQALYALDYGGKLKWKYPLHYFSQCVPAIDSAGTVYVGANTTRTALDTVNFLAVRPNGTLKFQLSLRSPDGTVPDIDSRPAISADAKIYVGSDRPHGFHVYKIK